MTFALPLYFDDSDGGEHIDTVDVSVFAVEDYEEVFAELHGEPIELTETQRDEAVRAAYEMSWEEMVP